MNDLLENLQPKEVFRYFCEISSIPRGTGNEKQISDYLVAFAREQGLEYIQDEALNVIIKKPAAPGYEDAPAIILQGHMDMVCEKNHGTVHDFMKDPIRLRVADDMIYASDTTLGADNGIAVAYMLAILAAKDLQHPPLEALITAGEEGAMTGAFGLDPSRLSGRLLINLDAEKEGRVLVSSAGGVAAKLLLPRETVAVEHGWQPYWLGIGGLKGGHSGADIHKGRGNANKLMGRLLWDICRELDCQVSSINGGLKANAITREAEAEIFIEPRRTASLEVKVREWNEVFKSELAASDAGIYIKLEKAEGLEAKVLTREIRNKLLSVMVLVPDGVQTMSMQINGLVESSANLGVVQTAEDRVILTDDVRSSVRSVKSCIMSRLICLSESIGCSLETSSDYPEWEYRQDSKLRELFKKAHRDMYGREIEVKAIHAGLECGVLADKLKGLDVVAIGPNVYEAHSPNEHLSISSTASTYEFLLEVLKQAKNI